MLQKIDHTYICKDSGEWVECAARILTHTCKQSIQQRGSFTLALSGGKTPIPLFQFLHHLPSYENVSDVSKRTGLDWAHTSIFWVDERCVPPDSPESNFGLALKYLLTGLSPQPRVFRMAGEKNPEEAAALYEKHLYTSIPTDESIPQIDCIILGMGKDGHVASLFPESPALQEKKHLIVATHASNGLKRITMTLPLINAARLCIVLVRGAEKHAILQQALNPHCEHTLPIHSVHSKHLIYIIDQAAYERNAG